MLLEVNNLQKHFGTFRAVKGITFSIDKGRTVALLGPNGAGKTTTLQMLAGLSTPTVGTIKLKEMEKEDRRKYIGFLPQYPNFYEWMKAEELLYFVGQLSQIEKRSLSKKVISMLAKVGLEHVAKKRIGGFSGGMKQRLGIAQALLHEPDLILLDEPVSSLDPVGRREVMNLIRELKDETTIFFSTHVLHDAEEICDDILIMKAGMIEVSGSLQQLKKNHDKVTLKIKTVAPIDEWLPTFEEKVKVFYDTPYEVHLTVQVDVSEQVKRLLLATILQNNLILERFEVVESSLEDLFLKVVQG